MSGRSGVTRRFGGWRRLERYGGLGGGALGHLLSVKHAPEVADGFPSLPILRVWRCVHEEYGDGVLPTQSHLCLPSQIHNGNGPLKIECMKDHPRSFDELYWHAVRAIAHDVHDQDHEVVIKTQSRVPTGHIGQTV